MKDLGADNYLLESSGRILYVPNGCISLSQNNKIYDFYGDWLDEFWCGKESDTGFDLWEPLLNEEKKEIASYHITRWQDYISSLR